MAFVVAGPFLAAEIAAAATLVTDAVVVGSGTYCFAAHGIKLFGSLKGLFAAKATTEAAGATATAYTAATTATTTASTATASTAAATATTTATSATAASATTTSTAGWLASLAMTPVGFAVIGVAAGCAAYCAYRGYKSWKASRNKPPQTTSKTEEPPNNDKHDDSNEESDGERDLTPRLNKPVLIPKRELKKLLESKGREMYEKLKALLTGDRQSTVWSDKNYRIDPGHTLHGNPNMKTWNLQVQSEAESAVARYLKTRFGTHEKLIWDVFNLENPPSFSVWVKRLLSLLD